MRHLAFKGSLTTSYIVCLSTVVLLFSNTQATSDGANLWWRIASIWVTFSECSPLIAVFRGFLCSVGTRGARYLLPSIRRSSHLLYPPVLPSHALILGGRVNKDIWPTPPLPSPLSLAIPRPVQQFSYPITFPNQWTYSAFFSGAPPS